MPPVASPCELIFVVCIPSVRLAGKSEFADTTTHKVLRNSRHALAEVFSGQKIGFGWRKCRPLIVVRLCRST